MADVFVSGIPVNRAVLLRHTPCDERSAQQKGNKGAIPITSTSLQKAVDYIGRYGDYEKKGDIERQLTRQDQHLVNEQKRTFIASRSLDYISRTGRFEDKGKEHQLDASLWDQYGPISKEAAEKEMLASGGAFIDSIVTVKREYAEQLNMSTKQSFQQLLRSCWVDQVMQWDMIQNREDVRWIAAYHTDASESLHVHVYTWSAKGEIEPHATVSKVGTRLGKEILLNHCYSHIKADRNIRSSFLRDLAALQIRNELNQEISKEQIQSINARAAAEGYKERFNPRKEANIEKLKTTCDSLKESLKDSYGRIPNNYKAQSLSRDIMHKLVDESPTLKKLVTEYQELAKAKAVFKGLSEEKDKKAFNSYVYSDRDDLYKRLSNKVIDVYREKNHTYGTLRKDLIKLDARNDKNAANISVSKNFVFSHKDLDIKKEYQSDALLLKVPYYKKEDTYLELNKKDTANINGDKALLAKIELDKTYKVWTERASEPKLMQGNELVNKFAKVDMEQVQKFNSEEKKKEILSRKKAAEERAQREKETQERANAQRSDASLRAENNISMKYGISLDAVRLIELNQARVANEIKRSNVSKYEDLSPRAQAYINSCVTETLKSPRFSSLIDEKAQAFSRITGMEINESRGLLYQKIETEQTRRLFDLTKEKSACLKPELLSQNKGGRSFGPQMTPQLSQTLGDIFSAIARTEEGINRGRHIRRHKNPDLDKGKK